MAKFSEKNKERSFCFASAHLARDAISMGRPAVGQFYTDAGVATSLDQGSPRPFKIGQSLDSQVIEATHILLYDIHHVSALSRRNVRYDQSGVPRVRNGTSANGVDVMSPRIVSDSGQARVKRRSAAILAADVARHNRLIGDDAGVTVAWFYSASGGRSEPAPLVTLFTPKA